MALLVFCDSAPEASLEYLAGHEKIPTATLGLPERRVPGLTAHL